MQNKSITNVSFLSFKLIFFLFSRAPWIMNNCNCNQKNSFEKSLNGSKTNSILTLNYDNILQDINQTLSDVYMCVLNLFKNQSRCHRPRLSSASSSCHPSVEIFGIRIRNFSSIQTISKTHLLLRRGIITVGIYDLPFRSISQFAFLHRLDRRCI